MGSAIDPTPNGPRKRRTGDVDTDDDDNVDVKRPAAEAHSLNDLMSRDPSACLGRPLEWKEHHLRLLNCAFVHAVDTSGSGGADQQMVGSGSVTAAGSTANARVIAICDILRTHAFHKISIDPCIFFGNWKTRLPVNGIFAASFVPGAPVSVAVVDLNSLDQYHSDTDHHSLSAVCLQSKTPNSLHSHTKAYDPFIAAVLIGLAQEQWHTILTHCQEGNLPWTRLPNFSVFVISIAAPKVYYYNAIIHLSFLWKLYDPAAEIHSDALIVHCDQMPLEKLADCVERMSECIRRSWSEEEIVRCQASLQKPT